MNAIQVGHDYVAPVPGYANGSRTFKLKLWRLRLGLRLIIATEHALEWFAFCPAPDGLRGFSIYMRRVGFGWRWQP